MAALDGGRPREPRVISDAGSLPLTACRPVVGHRPRRRDRCGDPRVSVHRGSGRTRAVFPVPPGPPSRLGDLGPPPRARTGYADGPGWSRRTSSSPGDSSKSLACPYATRRVHGPISRSSATPTATSSSASSTSSSRPHGFWGHSAEATVAVEVRTSSHRGQEGEQAPPSAMPAEGGGSWWRA